MTDKKNPWHMTDADAYRAHVDEFNEEGGGLTRLYLVRRSDRHLRKRIAKGEPTALSLAYVITGVMQNISEQAYAAPVKCLACGVAFDGKEPLPAAFMVGLPGARSYNVCGIALAAPVCEDCGQLSDDELAKHAIKQLGHVYPDMEIMKNDYEGKP